MRTGAYFPNERLAWVLPSSERKWVCVWEPELYRDSHDKCGIGGFWHPFTAARVVQMVSGGIQTGKSKMEGLSPLVILKVH